MYNTRHSWSIKDGIVYYTCPTFIDKFGHEIELEEDLSHDVECMICDEKFIPQETLNKAVDRHQNGSYLKREITSPAGIDPKKSVPPIKGWHKIK